MKTIDETRLKEDLILTLDEVIKSNEPLTIKTKKGNTIIISEVLYKNMRETINILSKPQLVKNIKVWEKEKIKNMESYDFNEKW